MSDSNIPRDGEFKPWMKPIAEAMIHHLRKSRDEKKSSAHRPVSSTIILEHYNSLLRGYLDSVNVRDLTSAHIRIMAVWCLEQGYPVFSNERGYYYGMSVEEADDSHKFLKTRYDAIGYKMELIERIKAKVFQEQLPFNNN
jgi:hypothetical protein